MQKRLFIFALLIYTLAAAISIAQPPEGKPRVRPVTIPISIFGKQELKENQYQEILQVESLTVREDREEQQILSIRSVSDSPMSIALIIQDDLTSTFNLQLPDIKEFIRRLPAGTRVMVAYARAGALDVRQRFTDDREKAANSLRIVTGSPAAAPRSPFDSVKDVLGRFDSVPSGRRAILLFADGVDTSQGLNLASISQSFDLEQAVLRAQRKSVAVYSFYSPSTTTDAGSSIFVLAGQGALAKLSEETGGRAFYQGSMAPISFLPFFRDLSVALNRQFALTYLSTHMNKGYHKVQVQSTNPDIRIDHPKGYYYR